MEAEKELSAKLDELIQLTRERNAAQKEFESRLLEEFRHLGRLISAAEARKTGGAGL